jgi:hypothetical protein
MRPRPTNQTRTILQAAILSAISAMLASGCASSTETAPGKADAAAADQPPSPGTLRYDQGVFHQLLSNHEKVRRTVTTLDNGVEAVTESDDPEVAALLKDHVFAMKGRLETGRRVRVWDPLYAALFEHREKIHFEVEAIDQGVRIRETSDDPYVIALIHQHAQTVSGFVNTGHEEAGKAHPVPPRDAPPSN